MGARPSANSRDIAYIFRVRFNVILISSMFSAGFKAIVQTCEVVEFVLLPLYLIYIWVIIMLNVNLRSRRICPSAAIFSSYLGFNHAECKPAKS